MKDFKWLDMAWCCLFVAYKCEEKAVEMKYATRRAASRRTLSLCPPLRICFC